MLLLPRYRALETGRWGMSASGTRLEWRGMLLQPELGIGLTLGMEDLR